MDGQGVRRIALKDKVCIVTGANSGMGLVTATALAGMGAEVVLLCRSQQRGLSARDRIAGDLPNAKVDLITADLGSLGGVRAAAAAFKSKHDRLDVLVNNAGMVADGYSVTDYGVELTFAVNHLGPFLLTNLLLDPLRAAEQGRVVTVASEVHRLAKPDFDEFALKYAYGGYRAYCLSKLANILFTLALAKRLQDTRVTANCLHPGAVGSNFGQSGSALMRAVVRLSRPFLRSSEKGAETAIYLASAVEMAGVSGKYFSDKKIIAPSKTAQDCELAERLWRLSVRLSELES